MQKYFECARHNKQIRRAIFKVVTDTAVTAFRNNGSDYVTRDGSRLVRYGEFVGANDLFDWIRNHVIRTTEELGLNEVFVRDDYDYLYDVIAHRIGKIAGITVTEPDRSEFSDGYFAVYG